MSASEAPVLSVHGLSKRFGEGCEHCREMSALERNYCPRCGSVYALTGISFEVFPAEVVGIVGESGSGKSTIMNCLSFDVDPTEGRAFLAAYEHGKVDTLSISPQAKRNIRNLFLGRVYQNPADGLKMEFSALANVAEKLIASGGRTVGTMESRARTLLDYVKIPGPRMKEPPANYSGGMRQRVQIAKALSSNPPILLLDEVTTGLDLSVQAKVLDLIRRLRRDLSISMLLVSHDLSVVRMLADRTIVMLDGCIVESGLTDQILEDPQHPYTQELVHSML